MERLIDTRVGVLTPELKDELRNYYYSVAKRQGFPKGKCMKVSLEVSRMFGLEYVYGFFITDKETEFGIGFPHAWTEDANHTVIDFTVSQFNQWFYRHFPKRLIILEPTDIENYWRYSLQYLGDSKYIG